MAAWSENAGLLNGLSIKKSRRLPIPARMNLNKIMDFNV
jgi:hypothetical protein